MEYIITIREVNTTDIVVEAPDVESAEALALAEVAKGNAFWIYGEPEIISAL